MRRALWIIAGFVVVALAAFFSMRSAELPAATSAHERSSAATALTPAARARPGREAFVGSAACAPCHRAQSDALADSHHGKALVTPSPQLVKARFDGSTFSSKLGGATRFALRDERAYATTTIAGESRTFPISYVSGVWPLEQYVVATGRGKLQALGPVWDSRTKAEGGGRWLHVYGPNGIGANDPLFFESAAQNWNHMCAECHSTWVERRYEVASDSFDTRWAELSVGCEACHGPGAEHVRSAQQQRAVPAAMPVSLTASAPWTASGTGSPTPRAQDGVQVEVCAPCHSRREPLKEGFLASDPFLDSFEPELLLPGRYHPDGQVEGEVYEWGSFVQSRMYRAGVACSDCHNPHSGKLQAQGDALCVRCHEPARFESAAHSHHAGQGTPLCVDCHMPPKTFMQIDERRDHSLRIPRPDHSVAFGTPNACNGCHQQKSAAWAAEQVAAWFPGTAARPHFVEALARDRKGALDAPPALRKIASDVTVPAIARATSLERLGHYPTQQTAQALRTALGSGEPLVVYGAVLGCAQLAPAQRASLLLPTLEHPIRAVRIAAAKLLAGVPRAQLPASAGLALARAFDEVLQSFAVSASRAETHVEKSAFELALDKLDEADASLQTALRLQPCLAEAQLNLAELARVRGDELAAERALLAALACHPESAAAHHALGLWQVRARQSKLALASLTRAVELAPADTRFRYVLAVALHGSGAREQAIRELEAALEQRPSDASALQALASYLRDAGQSERAQEAQGKLERLLRE